MTGGNTVMAKLNSVRSVKTEYGTYSLHYVNPDGRRRRLSVGSDEQHAQRLAIRFNDWLLESKDPEQELERTEKAEKAKRITVRDFYPVFMERHGNMQSKSMQTLYRIYYNNICRCSQLADIPLSAISKGIMLDYMHARMKIDKVSPAMVNREAAFVRCILSRAVEWDILLYNPLSKIRLFKEAEKREVDVSPEQISILLGMLPEPVSSIVEFAVYSGFRRENILGLMIEQIRFHDITLTAEVILTIKGGKQKRFPLGKQAVKVLKRAIRNRKSGFVFLNPQTGTRFNTIHKGFDSAVRKLDLAVNGTKLRFHDLRHVFATWLRDAGVSLDDIRPLLGHSQRDTTDRYATINIDHAGKALDFLPEVRKKKASGE